MDDTLTFAEVQAIGTHNSFHVETATVPEWDFTHAPLDVQLGEQGIRQFELDFYDDAAGLLVYHIPVLDQGTTCERLTDCFGAIAGWSARNPAHHPLMILLEPKTPADDVDLPALLDRIEADIASSFTADQLVTPDQVRGGHADLRDAIAADGWPVLGDLRGRTLIVLHDSSAYRLAYTEEDTTSVGRLMFPDAQGDAALPFAAVHTVNDPFGSFDAIGALVAMGHLVRTRADTDGVEPRAGDTSRLEAALASGANWVSTDYPAPRDDVDYVAEIPGGTPSRCNPLRPVEGCTPEAVEDPAFLTP